MFQLDTGLAILAFFVVIGPLIFFHELGHFLAARLFNIKVEEFGIGFPPRAATLFEQGGTVFTLNWIPLGGFVRPIGEDDPSVPGGLAGASRTARISVLSAGAAANFVVAFVLLVVMFMVGAPIDQPGARITVVEPGSPAEEAGIAVDDIVLQADEQAIDTSQDLTSYVFANTGEAIALTIDRGGETVNVTLTPRENPPEGEGPTGIQISSVFTVEQFGLFESIARGWQELWDLILTLVRAPILIIEQQLPARYLRPVSVVGISQIGGQTIEASIEANALFPVIRLTAYISIALAVTNLLPIPALDGGRILFVIIEAIRGKRIKPEHETTVHFLGFAALLALMVVIIVLDIVDPLVP